LEIMFELFDAKAEYCIREGTSLPHWYQAGVSYFVTFRTEDPMPADASRRWHAERADWLRRHGILPEKGERHSENACYTAAPRHSESACYGRSLQERVQQLPRSVRQQYHDLFSRRYLETLDKGLGACLLRRRDLQQIVSDTLRHFDGERYHLGDFVVMPNHVHLIVGLLGETEIEAQCASWKRFSARQINQRLGTRGRFWQEESFDHLIRSPEQFDAIERYIRVNPSHLPEGDYLQYRREPIDGDDGGLRGMAA
jgi:putative transposase